MRRLESALGCLAVKDWIDPLAKHLLYTLAGSSIIITLSPKLWPRLLSREIKKWWWWRQNRLQNGLKGCRVAINFSNFSADDNGSGGVPIMGLRKMQILALGYAGAIAAVPSLWPLASCRPPILASS